MKDLIIDIIGVYSPVTYEVEELTTFGAVRYDCIPAGVSGLDIPFCVASLCLLVTVYCCFKLLGGVLCDR